MSAEKVYHTISMLVFFEIVKISINLANVLRLDS